jgi:hypothetical protein
VKTRNPENPKTRKPENPKTRKPENPKTRKPENPKTQTHISEKFRTKQECSDRRQLFTRDTFMSKTSRRRDNAQERQAKGREKINN